jgi:hypothetical protein
MKPKPSVAVARFLPGQVKDLSAHMYMTYTIAECTVNKLLMMGRGRVSCRSKFGKLVHLVGFIIKKFVTMQHGHMNVKKCSC